MPDVKRGLSTAGIRWIEVEDAEADDVIATLAHRATGRDIAIMPANRDFYQLVTDRVLVLNTAKHPGQRLIDPKQIEAKYGVPPAAWCDRIALAGTAQTGSKGSAASAPSPPPVSSPADYRWRTCPTQAD